MNSSVRDSCCTTLLVLGSVLLSPTGGPAAEATIQPLTLRPDTARQEVRPGLVRGSHLKVALPSLPYLYTSHSINGALIKPSDNEQGWEYDVATSHRQLDDTTYEFTLREGVRFQDGSPFDADDVVRNMQSFKERPVLYSKIDRVFDRVEKIDPLTVRFHLTEKYGSFMNDLIWMQFYTEEYLQTNPGGWNGKTSCPNLSRPGPFGLGPYILAEGYLEGDRQSATAVLKANPYYWDARYPCVETVTVYAELDADEAKQRALYREGALDITVIPPEDKVEAMLAPYSKLVVAPSNDNIAIHFNLINGHPRLQDRAVRRALNAALHRTNLLRFVYEDEGELSPVSPHFPGMTRLGRELQPVPIDHDPYLPAVQAALREQLQGLRLRVLSQDRYRPLWRGVETQWQKVGVTLDIEFTSSERDVFGPLLQTNAGRNTRPWDLLIWGNDDWYFNHPFTVFLVFRTTHAWSTIYPDPVMNGYLDGMFRTAVTEPEFPAICEQILRRGYDEAYMLYVPTPNKVFAVNKEVVFQPYRMACIPLWKIQVTGQHWSVRQADYPAERLQPVAITRIDSP
jgi:peptide/nickel transport system substrate-binding protein